MRRIGIVVAALVLAGCSSGAARPAARATSAPTPPATAAPTPEPTGWRKERYIPVDEAVARLARHVDVPVVLPRDRLAGIRSYRRWLADPKYVTWERRGGETVGRLKLVSRRDYLWVEYGYASPDGCGGRETAIPTRVLGEPALVWGGDDLSTVVWPVQRRGRIGRFGLSGSFRGYEILRLARSMETAIRAAPMHDPGC